MSSPLCNIYYGHLVQTHLKEFAANEPSKTGLFARGMDDFVYINTDKAKAESFLKTMTQGFPDYGCEIQASKTATNITEDNDLSVPRTKLTFCGALIDPKSLSCRPDYESYLYKNIAYSSKFNLVDNLGQFVSTKMLFVCNLKMKPLFLDVAINGVEVVIGNLYEMHYITALKLHSLLASVFFHYGKSLPGEQWLRLLIRRISVKVQRSYLAMVRRFKLTKNSVISATLVSHLLKYAMMSVLSKKFAVFYKGQKLPPAVKKESMMLFSPKDLTRIIKQRKTHLIKSVPYQRI